MNLKQGFTSTAFVVGLHSLAWMWAAGMWLGMRGLGIHVSKVVFAGTHAEHVTLACAFKVVEGVRFSARKAAGSCSFSLLGYFHFKFWVWGQEHFCGILQ